MQPMYRVEVLRSIAGDHSRGGARPNPTVVGGVADVAQAQLHGDEPSLRMRAMVVLGVELGGVVHLDELDLKLGLGIALLLRRRLVRTPPRPAWLITLQIQFTGPLIRSRAGARADHLEAPGHVRASGHMGRERLRRCSCA